MVINHTTEYKLNELIDPSASQVFKSTSWFAGPEILGLTEHQLHGLSVVASCYVMFTWLTVGVYAVCSMQYALTVWPPLTRLTRETKTHLSLSETKIRHAAGLNNFPLPSSPPPTPRLD